MHVNISISATIARGKLGFKGLTLKNMVFYFISIKWNIDSTSQIKNRENVMIFFLVILKDSKNPN